MAIGMNGNGLGGRRRFHGVAALSEINVTPFVDVVLVLLIIFMLTAHVMEYGIEVDVPKTKQVQSTTKDLPIINITKSGAIYFNKDEVNINNLAALVKDRFGANQAVYLRADKETPWDPIAQVMSTLGAAKLGVNVVTAPEDTVEKRRR